MFESKIDFVEKYENPANLPECRPIENFWSIIRGKVYEGGLKAKNLDILRDRINECIKKVHTSELAPLFESLLP